jgi:membrane protein required for colicin V production
MTWVDYAVAAIVLSSALLGWWRGAVYEVLSLAAWIAAALAAKAFAAGVAPHMPGPDAAKTAMAFAVVFVAVLMAGGIVAWGLSKLVKWIGLGWLDRLAGTAFGLLRGALIVLAAVLMAGMTSLPQQNAWRDAWLNRPLVFAATRLNGWLPQDVAGRMHY